MRTALLAAGTLAWLIVPAAAQSLIAAKAGLISYAEGEVYLDGKAVEAGPVQWPQMRANELIRSGAGRAEVLLNPCVVLHIDENSALRMITDRVADTRVELLAGSAVAHADGSSKDARVTVVVRGSPVPLIHKGRYRFYAEPPMLKVFAGKATVEQSGRLIVVGAGRTAGLEKGAHPAEKFDTRKMDLLDLWSERRVAVLASASGVADQQARQALENDAAARQAADQDAQMRNSRSVDYEPIGPPPPMRPIEGGAAPERAHMCTASGK